MFILFNTKTRESLGAHYLARTGAVALSLLDHFCMNGTWLSHIAIYAKYNLTYTQWRVYIRTISTSLVPRF